MSRNCEKSRLPLPVPFHLAPQDSLLHLQKVIFPSKLKAIDTSAFAECKALKSIDLPESLQIIGDFSFSGCISLTTVKIPQLVKSIGHSIFDHSTVYENAPLNIRPGALDQAKTTTPWNRFKTFDTSGVEEVQDNDIDSNQPMVIYDLNGVYVSDHIEGLPKGIYIINQGEKRSKIAVK